MNLPLLLILLGVPQKDTVSYKKSYKSIKEETFQNQESVKIHHKRHEDEIEKLTMSFKENSNVDPTKFHSGDSIERPLNNEEYEMKELENDDFELKLDQIFNATTYKTIEESYQDVSEENRAPLRGRHNWYTKQIKDCDKNSIGCQGGITYNALLWVKRNGINYASVYPYRGRQGRCTPRRNNVSPSIIRYVGWTTKNENDFLSKLQAVGPIQVAVCADHWQHYSGGVFYPNNCNCRMSNHAVVAIAAFNENGKNFWYLRNSWGQHWGISGHAKLNNMVLTFWYKKRKLNKN
uniref:CSON002913 protein n=1 Tax=Culicoides sonorensis TaxID=179676 RepID=A0A336L1Y6_CULSO